MNRFSFGDPNEREEPTREPEEFDEDTEYKCECGVIVPREEATTRMQDYCQCEDCDSSAFD